MASSGEPFWMNKLAEIIEALSVTHTVAEAALASGLPDRPGLYAWWIGDAQALPGVPLCPRPDGLSVVYVGIAPSRANSPQTLRSRVLGKHIRGVIGNSTLRRSLAALLWEDLGWKPYWATDRASLRPEHNEALKTWIDTNLQVSWVACPEPWLVGPAVVEQMQPPLNLSGNQNHSFYPHLRAARACLDVTASGNRNGSSRRVTPHGVDRS